MVYRSKRRKKQWFYEAAYLGLAAVSALFLLDEEGRYQNINRFIYLLFIADYFRRMVRSEDKWRFFKEHPLDFIVILPIASEFRIIRLFRIFKLMQWNRYLMKRFPKISQVLEKNQVGMMILWLWAVIMLVSIPLTRIEPQMANYMDALWWTIVTTTTVGYGDIVPVTGVGKIIGILLMIFGIGIVGVIIANISAVFFRGDTKSEEPAVKLSDFDRLDREAQQRIVERMRAEIELELFRQYHREESAGGLPRDRGSENGE